MIKANTKKFLYPITAVAAFILLWYLGCLAIGREYILPSPHSAVSAFFSLINGAIFWRAAAATLLRSLISFGAAFIVAVILASFSAVNEAVKRLLSPIITILRSVPTISVILISLIWLKSDTAPGLIAFLIGHIAFITAFSVRGVSVKALALAGAALTIPACAVLVWLHSEVPSKHLAPVIAYIIVISLMAAFAFATSARRTAPLITLGALAFYVSDLFVARTTFIQGGFINALLGLPLYYASLVLFALSTVPVSREQRHDASSVIQFGSEEHTNNVRGL